MPKLIRILLPLLILGTGLGIFQWLKATRTRPPTAQIQERVWRVEVQEVQIQDLAPELVLHGQVETPALVKLAAPRAARVAEVRVRDGQRVRAGALLVTLDERDFLPALHRAQAKVAELRAQIESERVRYENDRRLLEEDHRLMELARHGVDRARRLKKQRVGSDSDLDRAEETLVRQALSVRNRERNIADHPYRLQALEARLQSARAGLEEAERDWDRARVRAPFDGLVTEVAVSAGDQVRPDTLLVRLYDPSRLEVRAQIPAPYQREILKALGRGEVLSATTADGDPRIRFRLDRLAGAGKPSGIAAFFRTQDPKGEALRLGQMLTLRLTRPVQHGVVLVPFSAVHNGDRIYRVRENRLAGLPIEILGSHWDPQGKEWLLVRAESLTSGDSILTTPLPNAIEGLRVDPQP